VVFLGHILTAVAAYLLGSIPTGFVVSKARGLDIRTVGSGNIGATNVSRSLGTTAGVLVLLADAFKGWLAVAFLAQLFWSWFQGSSGEVEVFRSVAALAAVLGHNYTCWLYFKGGKGIATSAGVLAALVPGALLIILGIWIVLFVLTRYVSLASMAASFTLPFAAWITGRSPTLIVITAAMAVLALFKHRANLKRLIQGTESRYGEGKTSVSQAPKQTP
jgi:glycerol-3-phosphate acyltransferase PlsY